MLIVNGCIVTGQSQQQADIRIENGLISDISRSLTPQPGEPVIDAAGKLVMPGGVDVHTHMSLDLGNVVATDNFYTGTVAAACGGTTTIVDHMGFGPAGCSIKHQVDVYHGMAGGNAVIDYSFHGVINRVDAGILDELEILAEEGITSHKIYLTYGGKLADRDIIPVLERARELGVMICVHPENDGAIAYLQEKFVAKGKCSPEYHPLSRPAECEAEAINRMILFARMAGDAPLYIVHLTNGIGERLIAEAVQEGQKKVYAETCPQYLLLDDSCYRRPDGLKYIMSPPLRDRSHQEKLWHGLKKGTIQTVATDHCPFYYEKEKQLGADDFTKAPGGAPGVECRMTLLFSEGVNKGRLSPQEFVKVTAENPAKLFGMYPQKGTLQVGSDADIVIFDREKEQTITHAMLHERVDYTPYEGITTRGWPVMTISRGEIVAENGVFTGKKGGGHFIRRSRPEWL